MRGDLGIFLIPRHFLSINPSYLLAGLLGKPLVLISVSQMKSKQTILTNYYDIKLILQLLNSYAVDMANLELNASLRGFNDLSQECFD